MHLPLTQQLVPEELIHVYKSEYSLRYYLYQLNGRCGALVRDGNLPAMENHTAILKRHEDTLCNGLMTENSPR